MVVPMRMVAQLPRLTLLLFLLVSVSSSTNSQLRRNKSPFNGLSYRPLSSEYSSSHIQQFPDTKSSFDHSFPIVHANSNEIKYKLEGEDTTNLISKNSNVSTNQQEQDSSHVSREKSRVAKHHYSSSRSFLKRSSQRPTWKILEVADANIFEKNQPELQQKSQETLGTRLQEQVAIARPRQTQLSRGGRRKSGEKNGDPIEPSGEGSAPKLSAEGPAAQISYPDIVEQISKIKRTRKIGSAEVLLDPTSRSPMSRAAKLTAVLAPESDVHSATKSGETGSLMAAVASTRLVTSSPASKLTAVSSLDNTVFIHRHPFKDHGNSKSGEVSSNSLKDRNEAERVGGDKLLPGEKKPKGTNEDSQILPRLTHFQNHGSCLQCRIKYYKNGIKARNVIDGTGIVDASYLNKESAHRKHIRSFFSTNNVGAGEDEPTTFILPNPHTTPSDGYVINSKRKVGKSRMKREGNDGNDDSNSLASAANSIMFQTEEEDERNRPISSDDKRSFSGDGDSSQNVKNKTTSTPSGRAADGGFRTHDGVTVEEKIPQNEAELLVHDRHKLMVLLAHLETECLLKMELDDAEDAGCKRVWDKALCWPPTLPNNSATQPCPTHIPGMANDGVAKRWCDSQGRWKPKPQKPATTDTGSQSTTAFIGDANTTSLVASGGDRLVRDETGNVAVGGEVGGSASVAAPLSSEGSNGAGPINVSVINTAGWTDYSQCLHLVKKDEEEGLSLMKAWLPFVKRCSLVGYSISLTTLLVSFVILASLKKLRCPRNLLHLHLFASFILRAVVVLLRSSLLASSLLTPTPTHAPKPTQINESDSWWCRLVIAIWQYFITANYSWILMEGLYLHNLIFRALFTDSSAITLYVLLGWGLPLVLVTAWACVRLLVDNSHCWMVHNKPWVFMVLIRIPVAFSVFLNFFFFINVVRVLTLKLRSSVSDESMKYRKLAKSTLVLVPLFGAHYCLLWGLSTSTHPTVELAWLLVDQVFASFQGFFVAVLYCLMNGEVRQELKKIYYNRFGGGNHVPFATGLSTVMSHTRVYTSRTTRASLHSIQSLTERRERQSPSPKLTVRRADDLGGGDPSPRFTPSPDTQKMAGFNSVTEEMIELHPRNASSNLLGDSPETQRTMTAFNDGANQDELQHLIPKADSGLQNNLHSSHTVDQTNTGNFISGSNNFNGLEGGIGGAISKNYDDLGCKPSSVDNCVRSSGFSIGVSKTVTRNGKIGNSLFKDGSSKLDDTQFHGNKIDDSMTVNLMTDTGGDGMKMISSGVPDLHQKNDERGAHEPLISFHEESELTKGGAIADEEEDVRNGSHNAKFEVDPLGVRILTGNSQNKPMTEKCLQVNYSNNIKGSKVSTSLLNSSSQDHSTEDERHETML